MESDFYLTYTLLKTLTSPLPSGFGPGTGFPVWCDKGWKTREFVFSFMLSAFAFFALCFWLCAQEHENAKKARAPTSACY
jgi:hypothetical protein